MNSQELTALTKEFVGLIQTIAVATISKLDPFWFKVRMKKKTNVFRMCAIFVAFFWLFYLILVEPYRLANAVKMLESDGQRQV